MRILQIYKDYFPPVVGGIERHINILSNGLKLRGIDVKILVSNTLPKLEECIIDGIKICKAPEVGRFASAPANITFPILIRKMAKSADILHFHLPNPTATIAYTLSGVHKKVLATYHSDIVKQVRLGKIYRPFQNLFLNKVDAIIATSPNYVNTSTVLKKYESKCKIVPLGIDLDRLTDCDLVGLERLQSSQCPIVLFIGKFRYYKGIHILLEAMKEVRAKLIIAGDGELKEELLNKVKRDGLEGKVVFLGEVGDRELNTYLNSCSLLVLPSIYRSEAFGISLIEAMACGKPVISTELGTGTSYVNIDQKTGIVIPPNDPQKLGEAINKIINSGELRKRFGEAALQRARNLFSSEKMIDSTIDLYESILCNQKRKTESNKSRASRARHGKKIKILRVISRMNIGGPSVHAANLLTHMNNDRFRTKLVVGSISPKEGDMSYLINKRCEIYSIPELQRDIKPCSDLVAFSKLVRIISIERPQIVHTHTAKAGTIGRLAAAYCNTFRGTNVRIVHTFHGHVLQGYFSRTTSVLFKFIERMMARFSDVVIAISNSQRWELTEKYRIADPSKIKVINLGFDLSSFTNLRKKRILREALAIGQDTLLIGIVGRLVAIKNHRLFLEAAKIFTERNPDTQVKFVVVGDGELRSMLEDYVERLGIRRKVIFYGWERSIQNIYADLDILALTSINEGTPVSIIEAMASSVPVVTTNVGGTKDLLGHPVQNGHKGFQVCERGILCSEDNPASFAAALEFVVRDDPAKRTARVQNAHHHVLRNYSIESLVRNIENLYLDLEASP